MPLQEPIECYVTIDKVTHKTTQSNDKDVKIFMTISDYDKKKVEVLKVLEDIKADEYFTMRLSEGT